MQRGTRPITPQKERIAYPIAKDQGLPQSGLVNTAMPDVKPLYIQPATMPARETLRAVRSTVTHTLLAWWSEDECGLYLWDRRSNTQHFLALDDVRTGKGVVE